MRRTGAPYTCAQSDHPLQGCHEKKVLVQTENIKLLVSGKDAPLSLSPEHEPVRVEVLNPRAGRTPGVALERLGLPRARTAIVVAAAAPFFLAGIAVLVAVIFVRAAFVVRITVALVAASSVVVGVPSLVAADAHSVLW